MRKDLFLKKEKFFSGSKQSKQTTRLLKNNVAKSTLLTLFSVICNFSDLFTQEAAITIFPLLTKKEPLNNFRLSLRFESTYEKDGEGMRVFVALARRLINYQI